MRRVAVCPTRNLQQGKAGFQPLRRLFFAQRTAGLTNSLRKIRAGIRRGQTLSICTKKKNPAEAGGPGFHFICAPPIFPGTLTEDVLSLLDLHNQQLPTLTSSRICGMGGKKNIATSNQSGTYSGKTLRLQPNRQHHQHRRASRPETSPSCLVHRHH